MPQLMYSNKSNAVRGVKRTFRELGLGNVIIRADVLDSTAQGIAINLGAIADLQADKLGQPQFRTTLGIPALRRSIRPQGAVARCWELYGSLPEGTTRREAVAAAVDLGIAYNTAATQYQRWSKAR